MPVRRRTALALGCLALLAGAPGCGDDGPAGPTELPLRFDASGLVADAPLRLRSGEEAVLEVTVEDGRPHGLTVEGAPRRLRLVVLPGETKALELGALPAGTYRVAPDGAQPPLPLVVSP